MLTERLLKLGLCNWLGRLRDKPTTMVTEEVAIARSVFESF